MPSPRLSSWTNSISSISYQPTKCICILLIRSNYVCHDTKFFYKNIKHLFTFLYNELVYIKDWFTANKLSLNVEKTKYLFFHKPSKKGYIPFRLPKLIINNNEIKREEYIKFSRVLLGHYLTWKKQIKLTKTKIAKNIGIVYKEGPSLDKKSLAMRLLFINLLLHKLCKYSECNTNRTYLKNIQSKQKQHY